MLTVYGPFWAAPGLMVPLIVRVLALNETPGGKPVTVNVTGRLLGFVALTTALVNSPSWCDSSLSSKLTTMLLATYQATRFARRNWAVPTLTMTSYGLAAELPGAIVPLICPVVGLIESPGGRLLAANVIPAGPVAEIA